MKETLHVIGQHWWFFLSRRVSWSDLYLKQISLTHVWRMHYMGQGWAHGDQLVGCNIREWWWRHSSLPCQPFLSSPVSTGSQTAFQLHQGILWPYVILIDGTLFSNPFTVLGSCLSFSSLYPQYLAQFQSHSRCSMHIYQIKEQNKVQKYKNSIIFTEHLYYDRFCILSQTLNIYLYP